MLTIAADGGHDQNEVTRIVADPHLMLDDARAATNPELACVREIVALEEDTVTEADVAPP